MGPNSKNLMAAILVFVLLDLSILAINYWITYQLSKDAVAINLSGRQRMLSQRITKSLLLLNTQISVALRSATKEELRASVQIFDQTLFAFKQGGIAVRGDIGNVALNQIDFEPAQQLLKQTLHLWNPMHERMLPYITSQTDIPDEIIIQARNQMIQDNLQILDLMNRLTSSLERNSLKRANDLRIVQTVVFFLALINFLLIVRKFHLFAHQSAQTTRHYNELAMRDPLTGLFNRRQFDNNLKNTIAEVDRQQRDNVALVMIDLDGFKVVNDQYGHDAGDSVLRTVTARLSAGARAHDTVARTGGDEFMLICPDLQSKENADAFCQRLLDSLTQPIATDVGQIQIGASIGIAFYPDHADGIEDLIRMADKAMYAAKNTRKNCYICLPPYQTRPIN